MGNVWVTNLVVSILNPQPVYSPDHLDNSGTNIDNVIERATNALPPNHGGGWHHVDINDDGMMDTVFTSGPVIVVTINLPGNIQVDVHSDAGGPWDIVVFNVTHNSDGTNTHDAIYVYRLSGGVWVQVAPAKI